MKIIVYNNFDSIPNIEQFKYLIPIFGTQKYANYLKEEKQSETIWFVDKSEDGVNCLIPFNILKKGPFKKGMFLTSVVYCNQSISIENEKEFLNEIVKIIKEKNICDWIQQSPNWAIFNTYPDGAIYAPFGTYKIDLKNKSEENLFGNLHRTYRKNINKVLRDNLFEIKNLEESQDDAFNLLDHTLKTANLSGFSKEKLNLIIKHLKDNLFAYTVYLDNKPQASQISFFDYNSTYTLYAGSADNAAQGATEFIDWQTIIDSKRKQINYYDFIGALINPDPDTKVYRIQQKKVRFGSELYSGFLWKLPINKGKYIVYKTIIEIAGILKLKKVGLDIIDKEHRRMKKRLDYKSL